MFVKQNKGVFPFREIPPHAITFWRDFVNRRIGFLPLLCHRLTLFRKRLNAVSSVNIVRAQLSHKCACAQAFRSSICRLVSIGVARGIELSYSFFFICRQMATCEMEIFCVFCTAEASCRVDIALFRRTFCPTARAMFCVTLVGRPLPFLCSIVPVSRSFFRLSRTVR